MTTKKAIIATVAIFIGAIVLGLAVMFLFLDPSTRAGRERAALLGQGMALACLIPLGVIWFSWAMRVRKERERKERESSGKTGWGQ